MKKKSGHSKCKTEYCRNNPKAGNFCYSCKQRKYAKRNPIKYAYYTLKSNAKRRGKEFSLSYEEFACFCIKTKILLGRGRRKDSFSIDRINESLVYSANNIQKLTVGENTKKYHKQIKYDWENKYGVTIKHLEEEQCSPF